ncbi:MAG: DegV family protein [Lachnospira sp.]
MKTAVLTDTNSGITVDEAAELGIFVMPMPVIIEDKTYYEGDNLTETQFYDALTSGKKITTSQPAPGDLLDKWDEILRSYEELVYIPMSSGLSNSCSCAIGFAADYDGKVCVADNHRISVTLRESVITAKRMADEGCSAQDIKKALEDEAFNSSIYVSVNTLEYLKKGGRITPAAALLGGVLNIKPILTIQGEKLDSFTKVRGSMKKCEIKMIEAARKDITTRFAEYKMEELHIGTAGAGLNEEEKQEWLRMVSDEFPGADVFYNPLSASIACHTGPGAVGIGVTVY